MVQLEYCYKAYIHFSLFLFLLFVFLYNKLVTLFTKYMLFYRNNFLLLISSNTSFKPTKKYKNCPCALCHPNLASGTSDFLKKVILHAFSLFKGRFLSNLPQRGPSLGFASMMADLSGSIRVLTVRALESKPMLVLAHSI